MGAAVLGTMEGLADLFSLSKLAGGAVGHVAPKMRPWATLGLPDHALGTTALALVQSLAALMSFRAVAWFGRGFRSPLHDFMLADEVGATHFGRAYGIERAADTLGAVAGPLAVLLAWLGLSFKSVIVLSLAGAALGRGLLLHDSRQAGAHARSHGDADHSGSPTARHLSVPGGCVLVRLRRLLPHVSHRPGLAWPG
jgi:hypothetical protein